MIMNFIIAALIVFISKDDLSATNINLAILFYSIFGALNTMDILKKLNEKKKED